MQSNAQTDKNTVMQNATALYSPKQIYDIEKNWFSKNDSFANEIAENLIVNINQNNDFANKYIINVDPANNFDYNLSLKFKRWWIKNSGQQHLHLQVQ